MKSQRSIVICVLALFLLALGCQTHEKNNANTPSQEMLNPPIQLFFMNGAFAPCFSGELVHSVHEYISILSTKTSQTEDILVNDLGIIWKEKEIQVFSIVEDSSLSVDHLIFSRPDVKFKEIQRHPPHCRFSDERRPKVIAFESGNMVEDGSFVRISSQLSNIFYILAPEFEKNKSTIQTFRTEPFGRFLVLLEKIYRQEQSENYQFRIYRGYAKMPFCGFTYNVDARSKTAVLKDTSCFAHSLR